MQTKVSQLRSMMAAGDWTGALRMASGFPRLGDHRAAILDARMAQTNPTFCRALGKDPEQLISAGIEALQVKYST